MALNPHQTSKTGSRATKSFPPSLDGVIQFNESEPEPVEVKIVSTEFKFMPAMVRVPAGRGVTFILDNSGAETEHGIVVPAFGFRLQAESGKVVRRTIVFDKPGEFDILCDLPGHSEAGMRGKLIVR